jgi:hypothetical protein
MRGEMPTDAPVTLIGHPFATVGMGEQLRSHIAACRSVYLEHQVLDIFRYAPRTDPRLHALIDPVEIAEPPDGIRIFHINGDEVEATLEAFAARNGKLENGYNIIVPAWELPQYPRIWVDQLRKFNEVWALSHFLRESLAASGIPSTYIGQAVEVPSGYFLSRRHFGIRESAFVLLNFLDLSSYATRKNPEAVLHLFEKLRRRRKFGDIQLVLKAKKGDDDAEEWLEPLRARLPEAIFLSQVMSSLETHSLVNCCDCFASLHRSEGFGRGTAEAMSLGRLALATGWSGNLDYMSTENSLLVNYEFVPVGPDEYPHWEGQKWAEPDIEHALHLLEGALDDPERARAITARGKRDVRLRYGNRAVGLRILDRLTEIRGDMTGQVSGGSKPRKTPRGRRGQR